MLRDLADQPWTSRSLQHFDLPPDAVFASLLRNYLFAGLFHPSAEALVIANAARLAELGAATRTTRQCAPTEELLDIIAGFEALKARQASSNDTHRGMPAENDGAGS